MDEPPPDGDRAPIKVPVPLIAALAISITLTRRLRRQQPRHAGSATSRSSSRRRQRSGWTATRLAGRTTARWSGRGAASVTASRFGGTCVPGSRRPRAGCRHRARPLRLVAPLRLAPTRSSPGGGSRGSTLLADVGVSRLRGGPGRFRSRSLVVGRSRCCRRRCVVAAWPGPLLLLSSTESSPLPGPLLSS